MTRCALILGVGTSRLACRLTPILPARRLAEALETTRIHRVAGRTGARTAPVTTRPCRAPPHTIAAAGLIEGGQVPRPGDVSRAHQGILCLDELPECPRHVLDVRRQPLEEGVVTIDRACVLVRLGIPRRGWGHLCYNTLHEIPVIPSS